MERILTTGVIIGRFQLHDLHQGHREMIEIVQGRHDKVILFLGTVKKSPTTKNPLDFQNRKEMILSQYPDLTILPLADHSSDLTWSQELDRLIQENSNSDVIIYGGRDSFIPHYHGQYPTHQLDEVVGYSASQIRQDLSQGIINSSDFRAGIIYNVFNQYPKVYSTVDIALVKDNQILLGRKPGEMKWRFLGGFCDPTDDSYEEAAIREAKEEAGVDIINLQYVCSKKVNDWRYRGERDQIITTLYLAEPIGEAVAGDDINEVKWFSLDEVININPEHQPHFEILIQFLKNKR